MQDGVVSVLDPATSMKFYLAFMRFNSTVSGLSPHCLRIHSLTTDLTWTIVWLSVDAQI